MLSQFIKKRTQKKNYSLRCQHTSINQNPFQKNIVRNKINELHAQEFKNIILYAPDPMGFDINYTDHYLNEYLKHIPENDELYNEIINDFSNNRLVINRWRYLSKLYKKPYTDQDIQKNISPRKCVLDIYAKQKIITHSLYNLQQNDIYDENTRKTVETLLYDHLPKKHVLIDKIINPFYTNHQFRQHFSQKLFLILFDNFKGHSLLDDAEYTFIIDNLPLSYLIGLLITNIQKDVYIKN
jgi:hypothetical protein